VVLASVLHSGLVDRRTGQLTEWLGVQKRTIERWRAWWRRDIVGSTFWKIGRAKFMSAVTAAALPASVLERFETPDLPSKLVALLAKKEQLQRSGRWGPLLQASAISNSASRSPIGSKGNGN